MVPPRISYYEGIRCDKGDLRFVKATEGRSEVADTNRNYGIQAMQACTTHRCAASRKRANASLNS